MRVLWGGGEAAATEAWGSPGGGMGTLMGTEGPPIMLETGDPTCMGWLKPCGGGGMGAPPPPGRGLLEEAGGGCTGTGTGTLLCAGTEEDGGGGAPGGIMGADGMPVEGGGEGTAGRGGGGAGPEWGGPGGAPRCAVVASGGGCGGFTTAGGRAWGGWGWPPGGAPGGPPALAAPDSLWGMKPEPLLTFSTWLAGGGAEDVLIMGPDIAGPFPVPGSTAWLKDPNWSVAGSPDAGGAGGAWTTGAWAGAGAGAWAAAWAGASGAGGASWAAGVAGGGGCGGGAAGVEAMRAQDMEVGGAAPGAGPGMLGAVGALLPLDPGLLASGVSVLGRWW